MNGRKIIFWALLYSSLFIMAGVYVVLAYWTEDYDMLRTSLVEPYDVLEVGDSFEVISHNESQGFQVGDATFCYGSHFTFTSPISANLPYTVYLTYEASGPGYPGFSSARWQRGDTQGDGHCPCASGCNFTVMGNGDGQPWLRSYHTFTQCSGWVANYPYYVCFPDLGGAPDRWVRKIQLSGNTVQTTTWQEPPSGAAEFCNLENYSFDNELDGWDYGDWVTWEDEGYIQLHECSDELNSYVSQPITLTATGPSDHWEIAISARTPFDVEPSAAPLVRWKLDSMIPGDDPDWYQDQFHVFEHDWWSNLSSYIRESDAPAITDTLTIWTSKEDVQIDWVCLTYHAGPATMTPVCPISPTYTPNPTYTPLPTPTPANTATATAWAATATAWPTQGPYPTEPAPVCPGYSSPGIGVDIIWLAAQIIMLLAAFFEAVFKLLATILQPIFDFFGFLIWLAGAAFSLIAAIIDLIVDALTFLFSFIGLFFDLLEIIGAFFVALWNVLTMTPTDPGVEIPEYFAWGVAVLDFLMEDTPLQYLELIAMGLASLLIIRWTIRQFSDWGG